MPPWLQGSSIRAAGRPPTSTVVEPITIASGGADTGDDVAHARAGHAANQDVRRARAGDRAADMRDQHGQHRANMHVGQPGCGKPHDGKYIDFAVEVTYKM